MNLFTLVNFIIESVDKNNRDIQQVRKKLLKKLDIESLYKNKITISFNKEYFNFAFLRNFPNRDIGLGLILNLKDDSIYLEISDNLTIEDLNYQLEDFKDDVTFALSHGRRLFELSINFD